MTTSILVINNNGPMRHFERQMLEREGYLVQETTLDFKLPAWSEGNIYDLFVLNLNDKMVGYDEWVRWMPAKIHIPVIVLVSCCENNFAVKLLDAGADDIVLR